MQINSLTEIKEHVCSRTLEKQTWVWRVKNLWQIAEQIGIEKKFLEEFNLDVDYWFKDIESPTLKNVTYHCKKIMEADLSFPIILAPDGTVLDGLHRIAKALVMGKNVISTIKLQQLPQPDYFIVHQHNDEE